MNIYVAGPMRGLPLFNFPAFHAATARLRELGHTVFNPAERDEMVHGKDIASSPTGDIRDAENKGFNLRNALAADLEWICHKADAVALLPGWEKSRGAIAERAVADALGLRVLFIDEKNVHEFVSLSRAAA